MQKVKGVSPETLIVTNLGIVEVKHLAFTNIPGVKVEPSNFFKVKNKEGEWVTITGVTNLGQQPVRDFILSDGRGFILGEGQSVLSKETYLQGSSIQEDKIISIYSEGDLDRPPTDRIEGYPNTPLGNHNLSLIKLLGMITAFGVVIPESGVIGLREVPSRVTLEFTTLMDRVFNLNDNYLTNTQQTRGFCSLHYTHCGLARWMYGVLDKGIPCEIMKASKEQMLMFLNGMYDPRYLQIKSTIRGGKYVYSGSNYKVARQVFSILRSLGYSPLLIHEDNKTVSVMTVGVNILEDNVNRTTVVKNDITELRVIETCNYIDELYLIDIEQGDNFIADGLVIKVEE